jgi:hypothetical protein
MLGEFYQLMGWDDLGRPTEAKLLELGLPAENEWVKGQVAGPDGLVREILTPAPWRR